MVATNVDVSDTVNMADQFISVYYPDVQETANWTITSVQNWVYAVSASDTVTTDARYPGAIKAAAAVAADTCDISSASSGGWGITILEALGLEATGAPQTTYHMLVAEVGRIRDRLQLGLGLSVSDTVTLTLVSAQRSAYALVDTAMIDGAAAPIAKYYAAQTEGARVGVFFARVVGDALADTVQVGGTAAGAGLFAQLLSDTVGTSETVAGPLLLKVVTAEAMDVTASDAVQMFYEDHLSDEVAVTALYLSPGGSVTTWALNTKNAAVTEYTNYAFNSFAQVGGRYLGASQDGLYKLTGETDAGTDIIGTLKTGLAQLGGSRFTSFKAAYLGVRGGGEFVLKLETGDGHAYHYRVVANDMATTKIRLGKGLRARYFSFELISTGQDFDLDTLEFVPIVASRRV